MSPDDLNIHNSQNLNQSHCHAKRKKNHSEAVPGYSSTSLIGHHHLSYLREEETFIITLL